MLLPISKLGKRYLGLGYRSYFSRINFYFPDLGQKIKQGKIKKLYINQGDKVQQFQQIADVQSDKQFTQITAPNAGIIAKLYYKQNQTCQVGKIFLQIQTDQKQIANKNNQLQPTKSHSKNQSSHKISTKQHQQQHQHVYDDKILTSPAVRLMAKSNKIDLNKITGTGKKGRILKEDIINYLQQKSHKKHDHKQQKPSSSSSSQNSRKCSMSLFQRGLQKSMTQSIKIPHLYYHESMDITQLQQIKQRLSYSGIKISIMGIMIKTFSLALDKNTKINSTYRPDKNQFAYMTHLQQNISVGIHTQQGFVAPNIKNVGQLNILRIQQKLNSLNILANENKLSREFLEGGTICMTDVGAIAGISSNPLILYPQVCIVAIGRVCEAPCFFGGHYVKKKYVTMSFGCDHRVINGAEVGKFSNDWKNFLQNPDLTMTNMR